MGKFESLLEEIKNYDALSEERQCELFDECEAWYVFSMLWHGGQDDPLYAVTGRLEDAGYNPGPFVGSYEHLTEGGKEYYDQLCSDFGFERQEDD